MQTTNKLTFALMSLEEARRVEWQILKEPYKGERGALGYLLDKEKIDFVDLAWITKHAWDPHKKRAAYTLLKDVLGQQETVEAVLRHGPEVVGNNKYLEEQQWTSFSDAVNTLVLGGGGSFIVAIGIIWTYVKLVVIDHRPWLMNLIIAIFFIIVLLIPMSLYTWRRFKREYVKSKNFQAGREGEERVMESIRAKLDNRWTVFRNFTHGSHKGDCDIVLIGPPGVRVLEVKAYGNTVRVHEGKLQFQAKGGWKPTENNPENQVKKSAVRLHDLLNRQGVPVRYVEPSLVLTQPQPMNNFENTEVSLWLHHQVNDKLAELNDAPEKLTQEVRDRIIGILREADEKAKQNEKAGWLRLHILD